MAGLLLGQFRNLTWYFLVAIEEQRVSLQFKKYYERNKDIPAPIRLELCISHSGGQTTPSEPLVRYCRESVTLIFDCPLGIILLFGNRFSSNPSETCQFGIVKLSHFFVSHGSPCFFHN